MDPKAGMIRLVLPGTRAVNRWITITQSLALDARFSDSFRMADSRKYSQHDVDFSMWRRMLGDSLPDRAHEGRSGSASGSD